MEQQVGLHLGRLLSYTQALSSLKNNTLAYFAAESLMKILLLTLSPKNQQRKKKKFYNIGSSCWQLSAACSCSAAICHLLQQVHLPSCRKTC
jgi:hypothetical protein